MNFKNIIRSVVIIVVGALVVNQVANAAATVLFGYQGGTGYGPTTSASNVGKFVRVSSSSPYLTYDFASVLSATPTLQQVTDAGAVTTNAITYAGGTSTAGLVVQGILSAPTGSFTYTDATTTNATFATVGTLTGSNATITNVSSTNMSVSSSLLVAGTFGLTGAATLGSTLAVTGVSTLATTSITALSVSGNTTGTSAYYTGLTVAGTSDLQGAVFIGTSGATVNGGVTAIGVTSTNLFATTARFSSLSLVNPLPLTSGGTNASLSASNGGIFYSTATAGAILAGTATANQVLLSGSSAAPSWSTATYPAATTINQLLYSSSANTIAGLTTANNGVLITSAGGVPSIGSTLPSAVQGNITSLGTLSSLTVSGGSTSLATTTISSLTLTNPLPLASGGTNASLTASNGGIFYSTASAGAILSGTATANKVLMSGASGAPSWSTPTFPNASATAGKIIRSDGTNWLASTLTMPDTTAVSTLLYSSSANTIAALATANNGVLVTSAGGVPSIGSTLPTAVQGNITSVGTLTGLTVSGVTSLATTTMTAATSTSLVVTGAISGSTLSLSSTLNVSGVSTLATTTITQLTVSGNATTTGNQVISGTAKVTGATTLSGALTVSGLSSLASTTITGNATTTVNQVIGGTLSVAGASTLTGNITAAGTLTATSSVTNTLKIATNGFTKFGELAPNIKTAYFTGTTPDGSAGGGATTVTLTGINATKIISITVMFDFTGTGWWMMAGYGTSPGYKLDWYTDNDTSNTTLYLNTANLPDSINVGANDARIYVTYIE